MMALMALGALLVVLGLGGAMNACMGDAAEYDTTVAMFSGLAFAIGLLMVGIGAASGGYHRKPIGAPPRDMDPAAAEEPTPVNAEPGPAASPVVDGAAGLSEAPERPTPPPPGVPPVRH
jgi:hypothetical protein